VCRRAERLYQQLDALRSLRQDARQELLAESRKHPAARLLQQIPCIGPIRAALLIALIQTPHRFRTKRQLWAYSGLALATRTSAEYRFLNGQLQRSKKLLAVRGLNANHNHDLKNIFKGAATLASVTAGPFQDFYLALLAKGMKVPMARLTLARKIAAITLIVWKKGARFDAEHLKQPAAGAPRIEPFPSLDHSWWWPSVLETLGFEGEYQPVKLGPACLGHRSHRADPMPPRTTRKSYRPQVSDRTMVGT
jgi:transposase IS116/IS110/IS902 family protein